MSHFELAGFLWAAIGILGLISVCLLAFGRLGLGSIVAFLVAGIAIGEIREMPVQTVTALREFAELGVILLLFLIGLETEPQQLRRLGRDALTSRSAHTNDPGSRSTTAASTTATSTTTTS